MRKLFLIVISIGSLSANDTFQLKGNVGLDYIGYNNSHNDYLVKGKNEISLKKENLSFYSEVDYFYSQNYKNKRDFYINEIYGFATFENIDLKVGKIIQYWGALEGYNVTDVFNQKNTILDPFDKSEKKGSWSSILTYYDNYNNNWELGLKFYEDDNAYFDRDSPYYQLPLSYNNHLELSHSRYTPTFHLKYTFSSNLFFENDTSIVIQHGYDNKRYYKVNPNHQITQYAYTASKILLFNTSIYEGYIFKFEGAYTDVKHNNLMSDYGQLALGIEKELYAQDSLNVTLYTEYYRYFYKDKSKQKNSDLSELYDNDVFIATKISFNDISDSEIKLGLLHDLGKKETFLKVEGKTKISDNFVLQSEILHFSDNFKTYENLQGHTRFKVGLYYYF